MKAQPPKLRGDTPDATDETLQVPIVEGTPLTEEQKRLVAFFADAESKQLEFLDAAGKRIIELTTTLLGVLFAVMAFGDKFPPPYLKDHPLAKFLSLAVLAMYVVAMLMALRSVQPRDYKLYRYNLAGMREELDRMVANKKRSLWWAGVLFWIGSALLAGLIATIILAA